MKTIGSNATLSVVGGKFHEASKYVAVGDVVAIRHERSNPHDREAMVVVNSEDVAVGYIPAPIAARLGGADHQARVVKVTAAGAGANLDITELGQVRRRRTISIGAGTGEVVAVIDGYAVVDTSPGSQIRVPVATLNL